MSNEARTPARGVVVAALAAVVLGAVVVGVIHATRARPDQPSGTFCITFTRPTRQVDAARRAVSGHPETRDLSLDTQRGAAVFWWSETTANGAPADLEPDAQRVARGMREALRTKRTDPLDAPAFRASLRRLEREAPKACAGKEH
jgi:hypothetical protein